MVDHWLPYGDTEVYVSVAIEDMKGVLTPAGADQGEQSLNAQVKEALDSIKGVTLRELTQPDCTVAIAVSGTMQAAHAVTALEAVVEKLNELVVTSDRIKVILGNSEYESGGDILNDAVTESKSLSQVEIINHTRNSGNLIHLGDTVRGTPVEVRREFTEASLKIAIGEVCIDPYTGFRGSFNAVVPGIASHRTIQENRRHFFDANLVPGKIEDNPVKEDLLEAVSLVGVQFSLNFAVDHTGKPLGVYAGGVEDSWGLAINGLGTSFLADPCGMGNIIIVSPGNSPRGSTLYSASMVLRAACAVAKRNSTIILVAECRDGLGGEAFTKLSRVVEPSEFKRRYTSGAEGLAVIKETMASHSLVLVSSLPSYLTSPLGIVSSRTLNDAYGEAVDGKRRRDTIIIPYGLTTTIK